MVNEILGIDIIKAKNIPEFFRDRFAGYLHMIKFVVAPAKKMLYIILYTN